MFNPMNTSRAQALEFRDHVRDREPFRLQLLARLLRDSGGPIEELDASFRSLVPLWGWFVDFVRAGCPGVDPALVPSWWVDPQDGMEVPWDRALAEMNRPGAYVGEAVDHYVRLVWDRFDPPAVWDIYVSSSSDRERRHYHHQLGMVRSTGWRPWHYGMSHAQLIMDPNFTSYGEPVSLLRTILREEGWSEPPAQERRPSVLVPFLDADLGPVPESVAVSPVWVWPQMGPAELPGPPPANAEPVIVWRGSFEALDEPSVLGVLDGVTVADALREAGFVGPGGADLQLAHLLGDGGSGGESEIDLTHRTEAALAHVLVVGGEVRSLAVEPFRADRKEWAAITKVLRALAKSQKARLVKESHMQ